MGWNEIITAPVTFYAMLIILIILMIFTHILSTIIIWGYGSCRPVTGLSGMSGSGYYYVCNKLINQ
jgi:hypothetical protein